MIDGIVDATRSCFLNLGDECFGLLLVLFLV